MKTLVTVGRGGTGKSSFTALMAKCFIEEVFLRYCWLMLTLTRTIAEMLGIDLKEAGKSTIAELLVSTFIEQGGTTVGVPPTERIEGAFGKRAL